MNNNQNIRKLICFILGCITTSIIVVPLILWIDKLELNGKINLPDWLVAPAIIGVISLFIIVIGQYARFILKKEDEGCDSPDHMQGENKITPLKDKSIQEKKYSDQNDKSTNAINNQSDDNDSPILGFLLIFLMASILLSLGIVQFKKEVRIYRTRSDIKTDGKYATASVIDVKRMYRKSGKRTYEYFKHTILYDGHQNEKNITPQLPIGTELPVLYLSSNPKLIIVGDVSDEISDLRGGKISLLLSLLFGASLYIVFIIIGIGIFVLMFLYWLRERKKLKQKLNSD